MTVRDYFNPQLCCGSAITEDYFNVSEEDRLTRFNKIDPPMNDEQWEHFKRARLTTYFGTEKQVGDHILFAAVLKHVGGHDFTREVISFVERDLPLVEERYRVISEVIDSQLPLLTRK